MDNKNKDVWFSEYKSKQGNIGLGQAIAYYMSHGYVVSIPINDTQPYDLVVDKSDGNGLQRVSVKTVRGHSKNLNKSFLCNLGNSGGASGKSKIRYFDSKSCDIVFIYTFNNEIWEIPSKEISAKRQITLSQNYLKYKISK